MLKRIKRFFVNLFTEVCPNCESAWTGGHPAPETITFCMVCSNPRTGKLRSWVWKPIFLHTWLVTNRNIRKMKREGEWT